MGPQEPQELKDIIGDTGHRPLIRRRMRARVEAKAALQQAEELRRVLGDLRKRLGGDRCKKASAKPPSPSTIRA